MHALHSVVFEPPDRPDGLYIWVASLENLALCKIIEFEFGGLGMNVELKQKIVEYQRGRETWLRCDLINLIMMDYSKVGAFPPCINFRSQLVLSEASPVRPPHPSLTRPDHYSS